MLLDNINKFSFYISIYFLLALSGCKREEGLKAYIKKIPYESLQEGDIVFRRGTGFASHMVIAANKTGSYSHIGLLVREENTWKVIHAVPGEPDSPNDSDRVKMENIALFFNKERAKAGAIMRIKGDSLACYRAARHAVRLYRSAVLFDHQYNLNDTSRMYCTELVYHVYKQQNIDLPEGRISRINIPGFKGDYLLPADILQSSLLYPIYHF